MILRLLVCCSLAAYTLSAAEHEDIGKLMLKDLIEHLPSPEKLILNFDALYQLYAKDTLLAQKELAHYPDLLAWYIKNILPVALETQDMVRLSLPLLAFKSDDTETYTQIARGAASQRLDKLMSDIRVQESMEHERIKEASPYITFTTSDGACYMIPIDPTLQFKKIQEKAERYLHRKNYKDLLSELLQDATSRKAFEVAILKKKTVEKIRQATLVIDNFVDVLQSDAPFTALLKAASRLPEKMRSGHYLLAFLRAAIKTNDRMIKGISDDVLDSHIAQFTIKIADNKTANQQVDLQLANINETIVALKQGSQDFASASLLTLLREERERLVDQRSTLNTFAPYVLTLLQETRAMRKRSI